MKVLILGGTGATGRHLCEKAAAAGHAVTALVRDSAAAKLSFPGVAIRQGRPHFGGGRHRGGGWERRCPESPGAETRR